MTLVPASRIRLVDDKADDSREDDSMSADRGFTGSTIQLQECHRLSEGSKASAAQWVEQAYQNTPYSGGRIKKLIFIRHG